jgi:alkylhydroperoxidase/carboxymuconolactone decarboxylase family protein YurZ
MTLPLPYQKFRERYPDLAKDFESLGEKCHNAGPLDERSSRLVKLGIAISTLSKGGIKSQARKALSAGFSVDELHHAALLALPTIGFPSMIAAMGWIDEAAAE